MFDGSSSAMEFEVTNTTNSLFFYAQIQIQIQMLCDSTTTVLSAQRRPSSSLTGTSLHLTSNIFHSSTFFLTTLFFFFFADSSFRFASQSPQSTKSPSTFGGSIPIHSFIIHLSLLSTIIIEIEALFFIRLYWIWAGFPKLVISANTETTI
jgi:hypothetical protein